jgi:hypothetical protein
MQQRAIGLQFRSQREITLLQRQQGVAKDL